MWKIRRYQSTDRTAVFQLCGDTAFFGEPLEKFFDARQLYLDYFAAYYTDIVSDYLWVAEDNGAIVGYIMGCPDTYAYGRWLPQHINQLKRKFFSLHYRGLTLRTLRLIWDYWHLQGPAFIDLSPYPAHLHINTQADRRGQGIGAALMDTYLNQLRSEKISGVHLETTSENKIAVPWYEKLGFNLLFKWQTNIYRKSVGHEIDLLVYGLKLSESTKRADQI
ncbi:MAG TPA: GNAT family N-acetyltransferase [Anaerolineae bacterium]|nr:GNAT family N-acetyltransferase [Anaerolineae bacterium]